MERNITVFILGCNRLVRESIARILTKKTAFEVIAAQPITPSSCEEVVRSNADVLILDSLEFILQNPAFSLKADTAGREIKCVLVAMKDDRNHFLTAVRRGVRGYVLQQASASDVVSAIRTVAEGDAVCPPGYAQTLFDCVAQQASEPPFGQKRAGLELTRRQQQLVPLIARGLSNKEIAQHLGLSEQTVKNHIHRILRKVGVSDRLSVYEACQVQMIGVSTKAIRYSA